MSALHSQRWSNFPALAYLVLNRLHLEEPCSTCHDSEYCEKSKILLLQIVARYWEAVIMTATPLGTSQFAVKQGTKKGKGNCSLESNQQHNRTELSM